MCPCIKQTTQNPQDRHVRQPVKTSVDKERRKFLSTLTAMDCNSGWVAQSPGPVALPSQHVTSARGSVQLTLAVRGMADLRSLPDGHLLGGLAESYE